MGSVDLVRLFIWLFCAFLVERLVEGTVHVLPFLDKRKVFGCDVTLLLAFCYALVIAYGGNFNLFDMFAIPFQWSVFGPLAAAILMAGGSSGVHSIIKRWFQLNKDASNPEATFGSSTTPLPEDRPVTETAAVETSGVPPDGS